MQWPYLHFKAVSVSGLKMMLLSVCTVIYRSNCSMLIVVGEYAFIWMADFVQFVAVHMLMKM